MENTVTKELCEQKTGRLQDELKRLNHRMTDAETKQAEIQDLISRLTIMNERLGVLIEQSTARLSRQESKVDELRHKPAKRWEVLIAAIISAIVGGIAGHFIEAMTLAK